MIILCRPSCLSVKLVFQTTRSYVKNRPSSNRWLDRQQKDSYTREAKLLNLKSRAAFKLLQIDEKYKIFKKDKEQNVLDLGAAPGAWNQVAVDRCHRGSKILGVDILPYQPPSGVSSMQANILSKRTHENISDFFQTAKKERKNHLFESIDVKSRTGVDITIETNTPTLQSELEKALLEKEQEEENRERMLAEVASGGNVSKDGKPPIDVVLSDMCAPFFQNSGYGSSTTNNPFKRMANTTGLAFKDHLNSMDLCDAALIVSIDLLKKGGDMVIKFFTGEEDKFLEVRLKLVFRKVHRFKPKASRDESKECYFVCLDKVADSVDKVEVFRAA